MTIPTATYRLQFRNGMTFDRAAGLVPYLKRLGISHLYASPIFTATSGSTHGYDVTDANEIDPAIGGRDGFDRMVAALKAEGLGLILDIVPNHMAASLENRWWHDVIEHGEKSRYARHFDIDWSRRLTLPFLGGTFEEVLEAGEIAVKVDPATGKPALAYYDSFYPMDPETYVGRESDLVAMSGKIDIAELHDSQPYRLMSWRDVPRELSYRRFFEITGLAGVRVEDDAVFDDTHRLILELVHSGAVDGLRVDHVDGLADPRAYLVQLRERAGPDCYITVEKILGESEQIPEDWPVSGTTGYEFIAALSEALVNSEGVAQLRSAYAMTVGKPIDMETELRAAKLLMVDRNFAGEFSILLHLAREMAKDDPRFSAIEDDLIGDALRELLVAFPVYRTYGTTEGLPAADRQRLKGVIAAAFRGPKRPDADAVSLVENILTGDVHENARRDAAMFRTRFQQLTGPLMAKSVEDTLFFRHHALLALNEVGAEPLPREFSPARFHADMQSRLRHQPDGISSTSTHDTKRGEDARARLYALSEMPEAWAEAVSRWREMNRGAIVMLPDGPAPEPAVEWMLYQALAGVWPTDLAAGDADGLNALEERFAAYVEKALREAKLRTNWGDSNSAYEEAAIGYARRMLSPSNREFLSDFVETIRPVIAAGLVKSLAQTIIKLMAPGVPDIYQGSEGLDLSLVDPDNRREPDFSAFAQDLPMMPQPLQALNVGNVGTKQHIIQRLLHLRRDMPGLFRRGRYIPLEAQGRHGADVLAFARADEADTVIVIVALRDGTVSRLDDVSIALPGELSGCTLRDIFSDETVVSAGKLVLGDVLSGRPFAVLRT